VNFEAALPGLAKQARPGAPGAPKFLLRRNWDLHENQSVHEEESAKQKAIRLLTRQLKELGTHICGLNDYRHHDFKAWLDTTREVLERYLGKESHHTTRFRDTRFHGPSYLRSDYPGVSQGPSQREIQEQSQAFQKGCATAAATLQAAIKHVDDFGVHEEPARAEPGKGRSGGGGVHFNAPLSVQNLAIAADSAVQRISHLGNKTGADLEEISDLLQKSQDLSPNQVRQGVADVEALAVEVEKPEDKRNWKAVLDCGHRVLELAGKAVDLGTKLGPHLPSVVALVDKAKHYLK
jgi:hypothetical protein